MLNGLSSGILLLDANGTVIAANAALGRILNLDPAWLAGRRIHRLPLPPALRECFPSGLTPRAAVFDLRFNDGGVGERCYRVSVTELADGKMWAVEWTDASETHALRQSAMVNTNARDELQQAHEELRCAFELAETEIENSREQLHVHEALIEQLLRANQELMQANQRLQRGLDVSSGDNDGQNAAQNRSEG